MNRPQAGPGVETAIFGLETFRFLWLWYYVLHTMHPYGQGRSKPNILHASNVDIPRAMQPRLGMRLFGRDKVEVGAEIVDHVHVYVNYPLHHSVPSMLITGQQPRRPEPD